MKKKFCESEWAERKKKLHEAFQPKPKGKRLKEAKGGFGAALHKHASAIVNSQATKNLAKGAAIGAGVGAATGFAKASLRPRVLGGGLKHQLGGALHGAGVGGTLGIGAGALHHMPPIPKSSKPPIPKSSKPPILKMDPKTIH